MEILILVLLGAGFALSHDDFFSLSLLLFGALLAYYFFYTRYKFITLKVGFFTLLLTILLFLGAWLYTNFRLGLEDYKINKFGNYSRLANIIGYVDDLPHVKQEQHYVNFVVTQGYYSGYNFVVFYNSTQVSQWQFDRYYKLQVNLHYQSGYLMSKPLVMAKRNYIDAEINNLRAMMFDYISKMAADSDFKGVFLSLMTGNHDYIETKQWQIFCSLGIIHLVSISGLHINIIYVWWQFISRYLYFMTILKWWSFCGKHRRLLINPIDFSSATSILVVLFYGLFVGMSVPAQRAVWCIVLFETSNLLRIYISKVNLLLIACVLVILWNPITLKNGGAWISFVIIFVVFYINDKYSNWSRFNRKIATQILMTLAVLPLSIWFFHSIPWASLPVNLVAIPIIGDLLTPVLFFSSILHIDWLVELCIKLISYCLRLMSDFTFLSEVPYKVYDIKVIFLSYIGLGMIIIPSLVRYQKLFGLILFCSLFFTNSVFQKDQLTVLAFPHNQKVDDISNIHGVDIVLVYNNIAYLISNFSNKHSQQLIPSLQKYGITEIINLHNKYGDFSIGIYRISITNNPNNIVKINKNGDPDDGLVIAENIFPWAEQQNRIKKLLYINSSNICKLPEDDLSSRYNQIYIFNTVIHKSCFDKQLDNFNLLGVGVIDGMNKEVVVVTI